MSSSDCTCTPKPKSSTKRKKVKRISFSFEGGMKISFCFSSAKGKVNEVDLVVKHLDGSEAIITLKCSGKSDENKFLELIAKKGKPFEKDNYPFVTHGPSFQPDGLGAVVLSLGGGIGMNIIGVLHTLKLNLLPPNQK